MSNEFKTENKQVWKYLCLLKLTNSTYYNNNYSNYNTFDYTKIIPYASIKSRLENVVQGFS